LLSREAIDIKKTIFVLAVLLCLSNVFALNLDLQISPIKTEFTDEENIILDVNVVNYEIFSDAESVNLVVKVNDQNIIREIGIVEPDELKQTTIELGQFPAGNYSAETFLEYDFLGVVDQTQIEYFNLRVIPSEPIEMETYRALIKEILIPPNTEVNKEFEVKVGVLNNLEQLTVEFLFEGDKSELEINEKGTVEVTVNLETQREGIVPLEIKLIAGGSTQQSKIVNLVISNPENYKKVTPVELKIQKGEVKIESGKDPENIIEEIGCFVVGGCRGDFSGPKISNFTASSNQEKTVIEAIVDDSESGNSNISNCYFNYSGEWIPILNEYGSPKIKVTYELEKVSGTSVINLQCADEFGNSTLAAFSVEGTADVLILTNEKQLQESSGFRGALNQYINILESENLTTKYIDLSSPKLAEYGLQINNLDNWREIKKAIDVLRTKFQAKYILILGGADVIPIPLAQTTEKIPTIPVSDDTYADFEFDGLPDIMISRIPTPVNGDQKIITTTLLSSTKRHALNGWAFEKSFIAADTCIWPTECRGIFDVDLVSQSIFRLNCNETEQCLTVPPNCLGWNCDSPDKFKTSLLENENIHFDAHGSGYSFAAHAKDNEWYTVLSGSDLYSMDLDKAPLITTIACHGAVVDCDSGKGCITKEGTGFAFLANGASVYIGNSRYGYGGVSAKLISQFYEKLKAGKTVGEAMLETKRNALKNARTEWDKAVIYELQVYGDPTLKIAR